MFKEDFIMEFNFSKWQACGNDFVLVNAFNNEDISEIIANAEKFVIVILV